VGAAIASVNHDENGIWALLEKAAIRIMGLSLNLVVIGKDS
jgi:hypothetical protein